MRRSFAHSYSQPKRVFGSQCRILQRGSTHLIGNGLRPCSALQNWAGLVPSSSAIFRCVIPLSLISSNAFMFPHFQSIGTGGSSLLNQPILSSPVILLRKICTVAVRIFLNDIIYADAVNVFIVRHSFTVLHFLACFLLPNKRRCQLPPRFLAAVEVASTI